MICILENILSHCSFQFPREKDGKTGIPIYILQKKKQKSRVEVYLI